MTKILLTLLLIVLTAAPLAAQTSDLLALVPTVKGYQPEPACRDSAVALEEITLHLVIFNPSARGVGGWKAGALEVEGGVLVDVELTAGTDLAPDGEFDVQIGTVPASLWPNSSGVVNLADVTVMASDTVSDVVVRLSAPGDGTGFSYTGPFREQTPHALSLHSEESAALTTVIAPECEANVGNETVTWGALKSLYR